MQQVGNRNAAVENNFYQSHNLDKSKDEDVSDISDEEFLPGENDQGHNVASMKKYRVFWNQEKENYLLRCFNHYRLTSSSDHGLKGKSWKRIGVRMSQEFGEEYDPKACRNKMNVLRADYQIYKDIMDARNAGKDNDEFWNQLLSKVPRAAKWKDPTNTFPYYETLRSILEENGAGVPPLPYLEIQEVPANAQLPPPTSTKKRPRESTLSGPGGMGVEPSPRKLATHQHHHDFHTAHHLQQQQQMSSRSNEPAPAAVDGGNVGGGRLTLEGATEIILQRIKEGFDNLADLIKNYHFNQHLEMEETMKKAMNELNKEQYKALMENPNHREKIFMMLNDANTASSFLLYPDSYKINFLQDLLHKHK